MGKTSNINTRTLAGIGQTIGNAAIFIYGALQSKNGADEKITFAGKGLMADAVLNTVGSGMLAKYGERDVEKQFNALEQKLMLYLKRQNVSLDAEQLSKASAQEKQSLGNKLEDFLYNNPTESSYVYFSAITPFMMRSGYAKAHSNDSKIKQVGVSELSAGALVLSGCLASIFIKEKTKEQMDNEGMQNAAQRMVHNKPLSISAAASGLSNLLHIAGGFKEFSLGGEKTTSGILKMIYGSIFLTTNILIGTSSKKASGEAQDHQIAQTEMLNRAKEIIAIQPPAIQAEIAQKIAHYLSQQREMRFEDCDSYALTQTLMDSLPNAKEVVDKWQSSPLVSMHSQTAIAR